MDCIEGREFVQDHRSTLDLVEIGMTLSKRLRLSGQSPVVWGLNLCGEAGFCKNARFGTDPALPLRQALRAWSSGSNEVIKQNYDELWAAYSATAGVWDHKKFSAVVRRVLLSSSGDSVALANLADRLAVTFHQRALQSRDPFRRVEVVATLAVALLSSVDQPAVADTAQRLVDSASASILDAVSILVEDLSKDKYALLSERCGALSELHELPLRLVKVLGWASVATSICPEGEQQRNAEALFATTFDLSLGALRKLDHLVQ